MFNMEQVKAMIASVRTGNPPTQLLAGLGALSLATTVFKLLGSLHLSLHRSRLGRYQHPSKDLSLAKAGSKAWALVTGASNGIGLEFVYRLAARGFNVILHGRNCQKLEDIIKKQLQPKYPNIEFKPLLWDATSLTKDYQKFDQTVLEAVAGLNLTIVVHNLGGDNAVGYTDIDLFEDYTAELIDSWTDINARFAAQLTRVLLPILKKNQPALMCYVSSLATMAGTPYMSIYAASKSYLHSFVDALQVEFIQAKYNIELKTFVLGTVATETSARYEKDVSFTMPSTYQVVESCLSKVGYGSVSVIPWIGHRVMFGVMGKLPLWFLNRMMTGTLVDMKEDMVELKERLQ